MNRRAFVTGLGAVLAAPLAAGAEQRGQMMRVGLLWHGGGPPSRLRLDSFKSGLRDLGYLDGSNVTIDVRHGEQERRLFQLATELVQSRVDAIASFGDLGPKMAQKATTTILIVALTDDFVGAGLVTSLARPEGNTTGVNILSPELSAKRLSLLKELLPKVSRVGVLWDPVNPSQLIASQEAAKRLALTLNVFEIRGRDDVAQTFKAMNKGRVEAINVFASPLLSSLQQLIQDSAASNRLPAIYQWREHAEAGGLASYGPSLTEMWRQTGAVVGKVLKGARPADLPVEQPTKFELVINLKTAKALGLTIPPSLLLRADQVIE